MSGSLLLVFFGIEPCLEAFKPKTSRMNHVDLSILRFGVWVWLEAWTPPMLKEWTCLDQAGASFGLGLARGFMFSFEMEPGLEAVKP